MSSIYGSAAGANVIYNQNNIGVAFAGAVEPPTCTDEYVITNEGELGGVGTNADTVWLSVTSTGTVAVDSKISAIACRIATTPSPAYNAKFVCYSGDSLNPLTFICMTESADISTDDWVELDVVNDEGSVEAHTVTDSEKGYLWLGAWSAGNVAPNKINLTNGAREMTSQTYDSSNTVEPTTTFSDDNQYNVQIRMRATICVPD